MNVKINTKEKFKEIHLEEAELTAIMAGNLVDLVNNGIKTEPRNIILSLKECKAIDNQFAETLSALQTKSYDEGLSFVICEIGPEVEELLDQMGILENLNAAPTLSEAWDIVQMEEIERELLNDFE